MFTIPDAKPGQPTTLVFRDGHTQEVTNYAIMGQTVYVFDNKNEEDCAGRSRRCGDGEGE